MVRSRTKTGSQLEEENEARHGRVGDKVLVCGKLCLGELFGFVKKTWSLECLLRGTRSSKILFTEVASQKL